MTNKFKINKFLIVGIFIFGLFGFAHAANAATYYVATNGSDSNSGSLSSPFKTIQKATDTVQPGDKVIVKAGIYYERVINASLDNNFVPGLNRVRCFLDSFKRRR